MDGAPIRRNDQLNVVFPLRGNLGGQEWTCYILAYNPSPIFFCSFAHAFWPCNFACACINTEPLSSWPLRIQSDEARGGGYVPSLASPRRIGNHPHHDVAARLDGRCADKSV